MNTPPLLIAAAILFWGWRGEHLALAALLAVAIEGARLVAGRLELAEAQQFRVADLSTGLAIAAGVAFVATTGFPGAVVLFFHWLPVLLLPLALMQAWGAEREIALQVLFWSMRRVPLRERSAVNLGYPYLLLWLLAASAAPDQGPGFDVGLALLVAWALWPLRPRRRAMATWAALVVVAACLGFGASLGLRSLQLWLETHAPEWIAGGGTKVNPYLATTDIGRLGELKQSDAIVLRVRADGPVRTPLLLHRASYVEYTGRDWIARGGSFETIAPIEGGRRWRIAPGEVQERLSVNERAPDGNPVLSLAAGAVEVDSPQLAALKGNPLGAFQGSADAGYVSYRMAVAADHAAAGSEPTAADLRVPDRERAAIARVAQQWRLVGRDAPAVVAELRRRFLADFGYTTFQQAAARGATPLADFLERTRSGHCEHFASAATLLLREAGVPARYATGYSVQEWSELERAWIARERHAHAWVRAWVGGRWIDVDPTPPTWLALEAMERPAWSRVADAWSWLRYRVSRWAGEAGAAERAWLVGLPLALVLLLLAWRLSRLWRRPGAPAPADPVARVAGPYDDSPFLPVARHLEALGSPRRAQETTREWAARLAARWPGHAEELLRLAELHARARFDPRAMPLEEREAFADRARRWVRAARDEAARKEA